MQTSSRSQPNGRTSGAGTTSVTGAVARTLLRYRTALAICAADRWPGNRRLRWLGGRGLLPRRHEDLPGQRRVVATGPEERPDGQWLRPFASYQSHHVACRQRGSGKQADGRPEHAAVPSMLAKPLQQLRTGGDGRVEEV